MRKILLSLTALATLTSVNVFGQDYWESQFSGFYEDSRGISGIHAANANTVWGYAYDGTGAIPLIQEFTKTSDGGQTWESGEIYLGNPDLSIQNIVAVDANTAWVMASVEGDGTGGVFKTSDGGANWVFQKGGTSPDSWNNWVHFFDANVGVFGSDPVDGYFELYRTTDGGTSWTRVPQANIPPVLAGEYGYTSGVSYVGDVCFFYTNKGRVFKSVDKGLNWSIMLPSGYVVDFGSTANNGLMAFSSADRGLVFKKTGTTGLDIYRTVNGGSTWSPVSYNGITASDNIASITYVPGTDILLATTPNQASAGSWKSLDNGTTWERLDDVQHTGNVKCADASNCYSGGFSSIANNTGMFKSTTALAVNDIKVNTSISVYPNPVTSYFKVDTKGFDKNALTVVVADASGRIVKTFKNEMSYDVNSLAKGVYLVTITDGKTVETKKIVKK